MEALPERVLGSHLARRVPPLCPELSLWLVAGHVDLDAHCEALMAGGRAPYWAFCWGAGQALARYLLDHPELVAGKRVADLGAGSGIVAIAAARAGAASVAAVDVDRDARSAVRLNAALNRVELAVETEVPDGCELLLAADVGYDATSEPALSRHLRRGLRALVAEPERRGARRLDAPLLARIEASTFPDVDPPTRFNRIHRLGG